MVISGKRVILWVLVFLVGMVAQGVAETSYPDLSMKEFKIVRGYSEEALKCIECHAAKTPGVVEGWKLGKMAHAGVSCYDCHTVTKRSPMASQCEGLKGTETYISPMVSSGTCSRCHPVEVEQFQKSGHAKLAGAPVIENKKFLKLMYHYEGAEFLGNTQGSFSNRAARSSGCQMCHGTQVELGEDNKPIMETWPGGVGTRYPDGTSAMENWCRVWHTVQLPMVPSG